MDNNNYDCNCQEMNEARKPKRTFEQACKECNGIPHDVFARECMRRLEKRLKENGSLKSDDLPSNV